ncbi:MAG: hypothetical protein WC989_09190 [Micavibrio sp.]
MLKIIAKEFWRYWKWLCVAFVTTCIVLYLIATLVNQLKPEADTQLEPQTCLETGGTWNDDAGECSYAA